MTSLKNSINEDSQEERKEKLQLRTQSLNTEVQANQTGTPNMIQSSPNDQANVAL